MDSLVDTNVLVYRCDPGNPARQQRACEVLREGSGTGDLVLPHQALVEFVAVTTRRKSGRPPLLTPQGAKAEVDRLILGHKVLYPDAEILRTAFEGFFTYPLSWYDAHLWAYASVHGLREILSEDMQDDRKYGSVQVVNPFRDL